MYNEIFTEDIWNLLVTVVNRNFARNTNQSNVRDRRKRPTNPVEMNKFYAVQMLIENTYGNSTRNMRSHFKTLKDKYKNQWPRGMGVDRFTSIRANLILTREELQLLCQLLHRNFCEWVEPNSVSFIYFISFCEIYQQFFRLKLLH